MIDNAGKKDGMRVLFLHKFDIRVIKKLPTTREIVCHDEYSSLFYDFVQFLINLQWIKNFKKFCN